MSQIVLADTSCLILLRKIEELHLLHLLFNEIIITQEVANEYRYDLPKWVCIQSKQKKQYPLESILDRGEASSIAKAIDINADLIIIDELKARKVAKELGLKVTGTLGLFIMAKNKKLISSIKPLIEKIKKTNFRISERLVSEALRLANEV